MHKSLNWRGKLHILPPKLSEHQITRPRSLSTAILKNKGKTCTQKIHAYFFPFEIPHRIFLSPSVWAPDGL